MKKIVKKFSTSMGITLDREDVKIYDLKVGDVIDIEIYKLLPSDSTNVDKKLPDPIDWDDLHKKVKNDEEQTNES